MVYANEAYFTNYYGDTLTEEQYNYLIQYFDEQSLYSMKSELFNEIKGWDSVDVKTDEKYIRIDTYYDYAGNVLRNLETEVSKSEALSFKNSNISSRATTATHQTSMKKITLRIYLEVGGAHVVVNLVNEWLGIPNVKSYDLIGMRIMGKANSLTLEEDLSYGVQTWDGNIINYTVCPGSSCANTIVTNASNYTGVGVSMNIKDNVSNTLRNELTFAIVTNSSYVIAVGTYQHATSTISLSNSQDYSFSASGLGNVFYFSSTSLRNKYDNTSGLTVRYDF